MLGESKDISKAIIAFFVIFAVIFGGLTYYVSSGLNPIVATGIFAPAAGQQSLGNSSAAIFTLRATSSQTLTAGSVLCGGTPTSSVISVGMAGGPTQPFSPQNITVVIGVNNTVTWTNNDPNKIPHTVSSNNGLFDSGTLAGPFTCTFLQPGVYFYRCMFHPLMVGAVVVKPAH